MMLNIDIPPTKYDPAGIAATIASLIIDKERDL